MLVFGILAHRREPRRPRPPASCPCSSACSCVGHRLSLGGPTGYAINPARDLGPRIMHAILPIAGKGPSDWGYSWVPVVGPIIGGIIGAVLFDVVLPGLSARGDEEAHQRPRRRRPGGARGHRGGARRSRAGLLRPATTSCGPTRPCRARSAIVSGGGSGHEPMHGGFVGPGMLDAACPGEVFTSPTPDQMLEATKAVDGGAGVLHIVKNYTGDVMNFEMAAELGQGEGIEVEAVVTNDDVAVQDSLYTAGPPRRRRSPCSRRRSAARPPRRAQPLAEVADALPAGQRPGPLAWAWRSRPASPRARATPTFELGDDEMEIGIGIHGEPGRYRGCRSGRPRRWSSGWPRRSSRTCPSQSGDRVLAFVNGMGGTPLIELYIVYRELHRFLDGPRHHDRAQPDRQLHHLAGDGGLLDHAAAARRRAHAAAGTRRSTPRRCGGARERSSQRPATGSTRFADEMAEHRDGAHAARHGDRRRRPRHEHGPRHAQGGRAPRRASRTATSAPRSRRSGWRSSRASAAPPVRCTARCSCRWERSTAGRSELDVAGFADALEAGVEGVRSRAARPSRATRRWSTRCCRPLEALRGGEGRPRGRRADAAPSRA